LIVNFGHPHNTRIGERHWPISIFLMQFAKGGNALIDAERDPSAPFSRSPNKAEPVINIESDFHLGIHIPMTLHVSWCTPRGHQRLS
jgi:hypothetical protein